MMQNAITKRLLPRLLVLVLSIVSLWSCDSIYDDLSDCHMYIQFKYDYNMAKTDKFAEQCDKVEVFLFDANGVLVRVITDSGDALKQAGYKIEVPISSGNYTVMAWAGRKDSYDLTNMTVGTSTKDDLILKLKSAANTHNGELEPLWSGTPVNFTYSGNSHHVETIDLVRNTNTLNFAIHHDTNIDPMKLDNIEVKITAANGAYLYDNAFADTHTITYTPFGSNTESVGATSEKLNFSLNTLRFVKGQDVRFSVIDKATGKSLLPSADMDLIDFLLKTKPADMTDQEYLDRQYLWTFDLYIVNYLSVTIEINGWIVWNQDSEL